MRKYREPCGLFLEDSFAENHAQQLRDAGYARVERFRVHFPDEARAVEQSVKDPRIIRLCDENCWLLITTDSNMQFTHKQFIRTTSAAILATATNNDDMQVWVDALIIAKPEVERKWKKQLRPWFGTFNRQGKISTCKTITADATTRRNRPREMEAVVAPPAPNTDIPDQNPAINRAG